MEWDDDQSLLAAVRDGSERAFNTLIDRHQQAVRTFLRGPHGQSFRRRRYRTGNVSRCVDSGAVLPGTGKPALLAFSIAWRKAKGSQRRWFRAARRDTIYHGVSSGDEAHGTSAEDRIALRQALASLLLDQRAAVVLCLGSGYTHAEAAEILAIPLGTVKSYVLRGREKLRGILGAES
jgi:RNA polymerase sigma-70 factor (ECF subfamily)